MREPLYILYPLTHLDRQFIQVAKGEKQEGTTYIQYPLREVVDPGSQRGKQEGTTYIQYPLTHLDRQVIQVAKRESRRDHLHPLPTSPLKQVGYLGSQGESRREPLANLPTYPLRQVAYPGSKRGKQEGPLNIPYPLPHLHRYITRQRKGEVRGV